MDEPMMKHTNRPLFVVSTSFNSIGGHKISSMTLAKYLKDCGVEVEMLISPPSFPFPELEKLDVKIHYAPYPERRLAYFIRPFQILWAARKKNHTAIIAADLLAAYHSFLALLFFRLPIVQVIAGGALSDERPLMIPGIVVFSEELYAGLSSKWLIPKNFLFLSPGRIDFDSFKHSESSDSDRIQFRDDAHKILIVSRLNQDKYNSISAALEQINTYSGEFLHCLIVGDGEAKEKLSEKADQINALKKNQVRIDFKGAFRVTPQVLKQADLVIGQGRTVLEAIACGVPAAVSGQDGYFGLITEANFHAFSSTNLTGRNLRPFSGLQHDLNNLENYKLREFDKVYESAKKIYDASNGAQTLLLALKQSQEFLEKKNRLQIAGLYWDWLNQFLRSRIKMKININSTSDNHTK